MGVRGMPRCGAVQERKDPGINFGGGFRHGVIRHTQKS